MYRFWRLKNIIIKRVITGVTLNKDAIYQENIFVLDMKLIQLAELETGKKTQGMAGHFAKNLNNFSHKTQQAV